MSGRLLQLDDVRRMDNAPNVADVFRQLGYNVLQTAQPLSVKDLDLPSRSAEAIWDAHLIADHQRGNDSLQVLLFQLHEQEWESVSVASNRMRAIAQSLYRRPSDFLLIGTKENYNHLMLVNPRKSFDAQMNLKVGIRKLLIDRRTPTAYDRDRLEAIAAHRLSPQELYKRQCEAFDVEKLTKEFYKGYKEIFEEVQRVIRKHNNHAYFHDQSRLHQFTQRLLGRVMFLYFLQKKEFLGGDRDFLRNQYRRLKTEPEDNDFYSQLLEPLFFEMLNKQRPNFDSPWGKIPYLNGGLFDRDYGEDVTDAAGVQTPESLILPNSLFDPSGDDKSVLKFFNSYNFTVSENVQGDEDVAVDPEMLGKVFENLLAADERGQSGTFYTPRGIVHFMCVESLSRYLADESGVDLEVVKRLAEYESEMSDSELRKLLSTEQTKKLRKALESVKVCDPAVGSGAFPLGMMQVILSVWQAIRQREGGSLKRGSLAMSELKRSIIANNLYGVDIKPEAIEIAKLRMWLSMVVDIPTIDDVEPLPNLDYKLMSGNSLISSIAGEKLIPDPTKDTQLTFAVTPVSQGIQNLVALQQRYFLAHADERKELRSQILEAEKTVFQTAIVDRRQYWEGEQRKLQQDIKRMGKASKAQSQKLQTIEGKLKELDSIASDVERGLRSLDFFQWHLHFNDVFRENGGFDVVIGNPPYVRHEKLNQQIKESLKQEFPALFVSKADICTYFYGKTVELLRQNGKFAFISSNKWLRADYGSKLKKFLVETCDISSITDFGELPVFDASTFPVILVAQKSITSTQNAHFTQVKSLAPPYPDISEIIISSCETLPKEALAGETWMLASSQSILCFKKMEDNHLRLEEYLPGKAFCGIKTGCKDAFQIDEATYQRLIEQDKKSVEIIRPLAVGDDVRRWRIEYKKKWLILTQIGVDMTKYPAVFAHLEKFKRRLEERSDKGNHWWELRPCDYYQIFNLPKIVFPEICKEPRFTLHEGTMFTNNKAFIIPKKDLYLLGVLNSTSAWGYLRKKCSALGDEEKDGRLMLQWVKLKDLPIPDASVSERSKISELVQRCLDAKGQNVTHWEAEINDRVAHLYGLSPEEIKIIEGGQN